MKELNTAWDDFINEFAKAIGVPKMLRYINSVLDYYKTRRRLSKGRSILNIHKFSYHLLTANEIKDLINKIANNAIVEHSVKYKMVLTGDVNISTTGDDFAENIQTILITLRKR